MTATHDHPLASDEELAAECDRGALYERYARRLLAFLGGLGVQKCDLDDVHHDIWLRVFKALEQRPFEGHFRGWLFQVARNLVIDRARARRPIAPLSPTDIVSGKDDTPLGAALTAEEDKVLARCMQRLEQREAEVIRLRLSGKDYDEVCTQTGLDRKTAYRLNYEATQKLTSCVQQATR